MDFIDLDKVLDEFEEEEKQALPVIPSKEHKPRAYLEFLEKHSGQEWTSLNPSKLSSTSGYTLESTSAQESSGVAYDDPYDSFSTSELGFIADDQFEDLSHNGYDQVSHDQVSHDQVSHVQVSHDQVSHDQVSHDQVSHDQVSHDQVSLRKAGVGQSAIVTSLTRVTANGQEVNTVYTSTKGRSHRGISNTSECRGTIAYQPIEVQTDALSSVSQQEMMSQLPKSDVIVDGHGVSHEQTCYSEADQNYSPIYASMDTINIDTNCDTEKDDSSASYTELMKINQMNSSESGSLEVETGILNSVIHFNSELSDVNHDSVRDRFAVSEQTVGFHDHIDEALDESDINIYLTELDEGKVGDLNSSKTDDACAVPIQLHYPGSHVLDVKNELNIVEGSKTRSLADELSEAEPETDLYSRPHSHLESLAKKFRSNGDAGVRSCVISDHHDPDLVVGLRLYSQSESRPFQNGSHESTVVSDSYVVSSGKNLSSIQSGDKPAVVNTLISGKMEIETILDSKNKLDDIGGGLLREKMEIEGILDEVVLNQQQALGDDVFSKYLSEKQNYLSSNHNNVDVFTAEDKTRVISGHDTNSTHSSNGDVGYSLLSSVGVGARPKDPSVIKKTRPNSLLGLSKVSLEIPAVVKAETAASGEDILKHKQTPNTDTYVTDPTVDPHHHLIHQDSGHLVEDSPTVDDASLRVSLAGLAEPQIKPIIHDFSQPFDQSEAEQRSDHSTFRAEEHLPDASQAAGSLKLKRPTSLNLPARPEFSVGQAAEEDMDHEASPGLPSLPTTPERLYSEAIGTISVPGTEEIGISLASSASLLYSNLGHVAPFWIPDAEAVACMMCQGRFTMWKRRHHCRACGKVLCSVCCSQKAYLPYMDNREARVCLECHIQLNLAPSAGPNPRCPNPNNPNEYCSKVPPNQQASNHANPPVVMVPTGVLRTSGSQRRSGEPKQVMFSDGIRPGGDLTELDGPDQARPPRRSARTARRANQQQVSPQAHKLKEDSLFRSPSLIPDKGLPPLFILQQETGTGYVETDDTLNKIDYTADYKSEEGPLIYYAVNKNLAVGIKIITLDCCVNKICWCFVTRGMNTAGQSELIVLLELTEEEFTSTSLCPARDIFVHFQSIYEEALKGSTIQDLGHSIFHQNFLGNRDHGGFLFLRPTFQCLSKLPLPEPPYLFGILLQKWEVPWAKVFPIRLMLRLGAEYRYYPCSLVSVRNRKPVFYEIGHTIINLLADFRNYQYMLSQIRGVTVHMENKKTVISLPRNRYSDVLKVVRNSNEHVMAIGSSFSLQADSHLVCLQNEDGTYQTQAINIQNKPRLVTGASFVVFNGALKSSSGMKAKSSIVEDGLMVQVLPEEIVSVKESLKNMTDHVIQCGSLDSSIPEETVEIRWVANDRNFNIGVKSYIDETPLEGIESVSVKCPTDFLGDILALRWTRVYFLHHEDSGSHFDPVDLSRLTEDIAQACCTALIKHLDELKGEGQVKLGLRVNLTADSVGYEIGSKGQSLPAAMINNLDTFLVPIVHQASEEGIIMELVFNIVE